MKPIRVGLLGIGTVGGGTFAVLRRDNLRLIERATPEALKRVGVHAERGEESAGYLVRLYAGHDLLHLNQIDRIARSLE